MIGRPGSPETWKATRWAYEPPRTKTVAPGGATSAACCNVAHGEPSPPAAASSPSVETQYVGDALDPAAPRVMSAHPVMTSRTAHNASSARLMASARDVRSVTARRLPLDAADASRRAQPHANRHPDGRVLQQSRGSGDLGQVEAEERVDDLGVELPSALTHHDLDGLIDGARGTVGAIVRDRVVGVGDRGDARRLR